MHLASRDYTKSAASQVYILTNNGSIAKLSQAHRWCSAGMTRQRTYHALNRSMLQTWLQQISFGQCHCHVNNADSPVQYRDLLSAGYLLTHHRTDFRSKLLCNSQRSFTDQLSVC